MMVVSRKTHASMNTYKLCMSKFPSNCIIYIYTLIDLFWIFSFINIAFLCRLPNWESSFYRVFKELSRDGENSIDMLIISERLWEGPKAFK